MSNSKKIIYKKTFELFCLNVLKYTLSNMDKGLNQKHEKKRHVFHNDLHKMFFHLSKVPTKS